MLPSYIKKLEREQAENIQKNRRKLLKIGIAMSPDTTLAELRILELDDDKDVRMSVALNPRFWNGQGDVRKYLDDYFESGALLTDIEEEQDLAA